MESANDNSSQWNTIQIACGYLCYILLLLSICTRIWIHSTYSYHHQHIIIVIVIIVIYSGGSNIISTLFSIFFCFVSDYIIQCICLVFHRNIHTESKNVYKTLIFVLFEEKFLRSQFLNRNRQLFEHEIHFAMKYMNQNEWWRIIQSIWLW